MNRACQTNLLLVLSWFVIAAPLPGQVSQRPPQSAGYTGSGGCRDCHERFYDLWAPSHHGLAMQPYTPAFAEANLTPHTDDVRIGDTRYRAFVAADEGFVREQASDRTRRYPIAHVLGGKNVYYFLTPLDRGRLQTLPVAYDVRRKAWFDTAASGVRHFPGAARDAPVHWTDSLYTFNTSCHGCHVSQMSTNYDPGTDTYNTQWAEPGINCETCHGPAEQHVKICEAAGEGNTPTDLKIIRTGPFTIEQTNSMCASCHAKASRISASFTPGDRYFDHFDLVTLEHADFYPDGRDLGENYTYTSWRMSPCVKSGKLDCMHCHTSSGRYRFEKAENANDACLPCHEERVQNAPEHTHHEIGSKGNQCVSCHMTMTDFARMNRSDHSMRPPTPAATLAFQSPNACNLCHEDKDAAWADRHVSKWHERDYQEPVLRRAGLVEAARRGDWGRLDDMLAAIGSKDRDEVFAASLIRLLANCDSDKKWPTVIKALQADPSPLVRTASAQSLEGQTPAEALQALVKATADPYRLVRVRAASTLSGIPPEQFKDEHQEQVKRATDELLAALRAAPDDYTSQFNLGNFHMARRDYRRAIESYQTAIRLRPDFIPPHVNIAFVYNATAQNDKAEASFRKALALDPNSSAVHLNLGMLLGEMNRPNDAERAFRDALKVDPNSAAAAYNLGVMTVATRPLEGLAFCRRAYELRPDEGKYGYTYAFYLFQGGKVDQAMTVLYKMVNRRIPYADAYAMLGAIHRRRGEIDQAVAVYRSAYGNAKLTQLEREGFRDMIRNVEQQR